MIENYEDKDISKCKLNKKILKIIRDGIFLISRNNIDV